MNDHKPDDPYRLDELATREARAAGPHGENGRSRRRLANWPRMA